MTNKIMLIDLVGKSDINILVNITIKGQKYNTSNIQSERMLKKVYVKKDKKGKEWIYVEWTPEGEIILSDKSTCHDCGYSGLMLGETHQLDKLYMISV